MPDATYFSAISIKLIAQEMTLKLKPTNKKVSHVMCIAFCFYRKYSLLMWFWNRIQLQKNHHLFNISVDKILYEICFRSHFDK